jgi:signal transduction histidine kinase
MSPKETSSQSPSRNALISTALFVIVVGLTAWLRLGVFPDRVITLTYGLGLLVCFWHRDRLLLWALAAAFIAVSAVKAILLHRDYNIFSLSQWIMQVANILIIAVCMHAVLNLLRRQAEQNAELTRANQALTSQAEEIGRQNEELQVQSEELAQQNEELHQQQDELTRQNRELEHLSEESQTQSEELAHLNAELQAQEDMLHTVLTSMLDVRDEEHLLDQICGSLLKLMGSRAQGAALVEQVEEGRLMFRYCKGEDWARATRFSLTGTFAEVVLREGKTAYVNLKDRPDFRKPHVGRNANSILATPMILRERVRAVLEVFSDTSDEWTERQFRLLEWVAAQCSTALDLIYLRQQLKNANVNLERTVQERTIKLQEMVDELEHFSYTITHDMRAPLRAMQGFTGIIEENLGPNISPVVSECLQRVSDSARRMDRLITDALSYSKAVKQELTLTPIDAGQLLQGIIHSYPALQPPRAIIRVETSLPKVLANEAGLTQCFSNLLGNAVKFVAPGKTPMVRIRAEMLQSDSEIPGLSIRGNASPPSSSVMSSMQEKKPAKVDAHPAVRIWFEDNGIGIPLAAQPRIFQMFQRASKGYEGTGVGLALVRKVVARMGGRVGFISEPGAGSRFWIDLRVASAPTRVGKTSQLSTHL